MSLTKSMLLAGSSLLAAGLITVFSPGTAAAQATCTSGTAVTGDGTNTVTIAGGNPNNPGITCIYTGTAATVSTLGSTTVSTLAPGGGINLTGVANATINWTSTAGTVTGGAQTNGPVIDAQTGGAINLTTGNISVNAASGGDGIYAQSTNGGAITLVTGSIGFGNAAGSDAIEAISNGGAINITTNGAIGIGGSTTVINSTNRDGIVAQTSGAAAVTLDINNSVTGFGAGGAAVRVTNGTGAVNIDATGEIRGGNSSSTTNAHLGSGMVIDSDGAITIATTSVIMGAINVSGPQPAAIVASGSSFTLTLTGNPNTSPDEVHGYRASLGGVYNSDSIGGSYTARIASGVDVGDSNRRSGGHLDLSGITGGSELNFNSRSRWMLTETSLMSPGADEVNIDATSVIMTSMMGFHAGNLGEDVDQEIIRPGIADFGSGVDTVNNLGRLLIGPVYTRETAVGEASNLPPSADKRYGVRGEARLLNLEQFNNSGEIWLGTRFYYGFIDSVIDNYLTGTDRWHDDMLYMPGATFNGAAGSVIMMDVDLAKAQMSCAPSTRDAEGYLPAADCLGIQGGAATGRTELRIVELIPGDRGQYNPEGIVLVDLAGGDPDATDPGAFVISPDTPRYIDIGNGGIEKGVFAYILGFDADTQQFKLVGAPSSGAQQFPILATAANQLWRTATGGWFQRRVHQRDVGYEGLGTGAWFNVTGMGTERDISTSVAIGTDDVVFDNSYEQSDVAISFGWDLLDYGSDAALGAMVGYAHSEVEFDDSDNSANLEGVHAGLYGGYGAGGFFIDGAINGAILSLHNDVPAMDLQPSGTVLDTEVWSLGGRVEAGWRFNAQGGLWLEPLVGASAVSTSFEDMRVPNGDPDPNRPGVNVRLDSAESRRASAGLRFGVTDMWANVAPTSFSVTARAVNEFEGGADVSVENIGPTYLSTDALEGTFTQVTGSVSVASPNKAISGYLNLDTIKGDDYDSMGASIGVRLHW